MNPIRQRQRLDAPPATGLRPIFGTGFGERLTQYPLLQTMLSDHGLHALFAEPVVEAGTVQWYTSLPGEPKPFPILAPDEQGYVLAVLRYFAEAPYRSTQRHAERESLHRLLDECLEIPGYECIFLVGTHPVLTHWGFLRSDFNPRRGLIRKLTQRLAPPRFTLHVRALAQATGQPVADATVRVRIAGYLHEGQTDAAGTVSLVDLFPFTQVPIETEVSAPNFQSVTSLLASFQSIDQLVYQPALEATVRLPPAQVPADIDLRLLDLTTREPVGGATVRLQTPTETHERESQRSGWVSFRQISQRPTERTVVYVTHAQYADERLELEPGDVERSLLLNPDGLRGRRGELNVNLSWKTTDDLDLIVVDPGQNAVSYHQRRVEYQGYVGMLDVDANATQGGATDQPQENIFWENAPPGTYQVYVTLYKRRTDPAQPIPFEVTVLQRNERLLFSGQVGQERALLPVANLTISPNPPA